MSNEDWEQLECELCSHLHTPLWKREEGIFCDRCKEDWPDEWY